MYKLLAIDIDGTLIKNDGEISSKVKEAIQKVKEQGVKVVLVTGRPIGGIAPFVKELGLNQEGDFAITYNGAYLVNTHTGEAVYKNFLTYDDLTRLYALSQELEAPMHYFGVDQLYAPDKDIHFYTIREAYENNISIQYQPIKELAKDFQVPKVMFIDYPDRLSQTIESVPDLMKKRYTMVRSAPHFYEVLHSEVSKGMVLKKLLDQLSIAREDVIAIGDGENDLSMIKLAGCGVAMGNAMPSVKEAADYETLSNDEDGVAHALERFILS
ncbi:MAG TPA: sugar-phosphatase [Pseudogracilibacillus sp.]|nr:sugar-phosphatase [Pseudogracilibacillus sp.]